MSRLHRIGFLLLLVVLLPAAAILTYQLSTLDQDEEMLQSIYEQQLETLLYSVNQHAWAVADNWARQATLATQRTASRTADMEARLDLLIEDNPSITAVYVAPANLSWQRKALGAPQETLAEPLMLPEVEIQKLIDRRELGYQQIRPVPVDAQRLLLAFAPDSTSLYVVLGLEIDTGVFLESVLLPKLKEVGRASFDLGVFREGTPEPLFATGDLTREALRRERKVWLLPDVVVGVQLKGTTIEQVVNDRMRGSLILVSVLAVVLGLSVWVVYRTVRREMVLAQLKSDFVSNVSHELRTPLALIRMYVETLELGRVPTEEKKQSYYEIIRTEAERLTRLIDNILTFSKIEAGKKTFAKAPVGLSEVAQQVLDLYDHTLSREGFTTSVTLADGLPPLLGDAEALKEALINLVDNAIKYSTTTRALTVTTGSQGGHVYVSVADRGVGIGPSDQAQVFDKFFRVTTGLVHDTKGTGLGLSLVQHIVEAHGGAVDLDSTPGEGSRFTLRFPAVENAAEVG